MSEIRGSIFLGGLILGGLSSEFYGIVYALAERTQNCQLSAQLNRAAGSCCIMEVQDTWHT